jgi:hypothetical protein
MVAPAEALADLDAHAETSILRPATSATIRPGFIPALIAFLTRRDIAARGFSLAIVATGGDRGHAPARLTYEKARFCGTPVVQVP